MKKVLTAAITIFLIVQVHYAQIHEKPFEGIVDFKKTTTIDTNQYIYYVKGDNIRIDEINSKTKIPAGSFLVDLKQNKMTSLSHDRKLYMDQKPGVPAVVKGNPEVTKTKNTKTIQGVKCTEYLVKNKDENTEISFYIANSGSYDFFDRLLKMLNRKDKFSSYYLKILGIQGLFPVLAIQRSLDGKEIGKIETIKMERKTLTGSVFEIPKGYSKFDK